MTITICIASKFLSTLSLRRATRRSSGTKRHFRYFYPRSPCGERQQFPLFIPVGIYISIHALLAESDVPGNIVLTNVLLFLSTLSLRRATTQTGNSEGNSNISIHALLAESDGVNAAMVRPIRNFYPRSPCGERRRDREANVRNSLFLSTLSLRRATHEALHGGRLLTFLSTLSLRRATPRGRNRRN